MVWRKNRTLTASGCKYTRVGIALLLCGEESDRSHSLPFLVLDATRHQKSPLQTKSKTKLKFETWSRGMILAERLPWWYMATYSKLPYLHKLVAGNMTTRAVELYLAREQTEDRPLRTRTHVRSEVLRRGTPQSGYTHAQSYKPLMTNTRTYKHDNITSLHMHVFLTECTMLHPY